MFAALSLRQPPRQCQYRNTASKLPGQGKASNPPATPRRNRFLPGAAVASAKTAGGRPGPGALQLWSCGGLRAISAPRCSALLRSSGSFGGDSVARGFGTVAPLGARENEAQPWPKPGPTADEGASQQRCIPRTRGLRGARGRGVVRGDPRAELVVEHGSFLLSRRSPTGSTSPSRPELPSRGLPVQHAAGGSFKDRCTALL